MDRRSTTTIASGDSPTSSQLSCGDLAMGAAPAAALLQLPPEHDRALVGLANNSFGDEEVAKEFDANDPNATEVSPARSRRRRVEWRASCSQFERASSLLFALGVSEDP
jgi:hypothetical protein